MIAVSESPHQPISSCSIMSSPSISPATSPHLTFFLSVDNLLLCIFPHSPQTCGTFHPLLICEVYSAYPSSH